MGHLITLVCIMSLPLESFIKFDHLLTKACYMIICVMIHLVQGLVIQVLFMLHSSCIQVPIQVHMLFKVCWFKEILNMILEGRISIWKWDIFHCVKMTIFIQKCSFHSYNGNITMSIQKLQKIFDFDLHLTFRKLLTFWSPSWPKSTDLIPSPKPDSHFDSSCFHLLL